MVELLTMAMICELLPEACTARGYTAQDVWWLAKAIEGEGAHLFDWRRDVVGIWIAHTVLNRVDHPDWPNDVMQVVRDGFYGHINTEDPADWALELAIRALERDQDFTKGAYFVLSGSDLDRLDIRHKADYAITQFKSGQWELYFFREWPIEQKEGDVE